MSHCRAQGLTDHLGLGDLGHRQTDRARLDAVRPWFDFDYCLRKARSILDGRFTDVEWLDVAHHLIQLALVIQPDSRIVKVLPCPGVPAG